MESFQGDSLKEYTIVSNWRTYYEMPTSQRLIEHTKLIIESGVDINSVYSSPGLYFVNCIFKGEIKFNATSANFKVVFSNCLFESSIEIENFAEFERGLSFNNCVAKDKIWVRGAMIKQSIWSFYEADLIVISSGVFERLLITGVGSNASLNIFGGNFINVEGSIIVTNFIVDSIDLQASPHKVLSLSFESLSLRQLKINLYRNVGQLRFSNIKALIVPNSKVHIEQSYMGKAEFYNVDFDSFETVNIVDSYMVDCAFIAVDWKYNLSAFGDFSGGVENDIKKLENSRGLNYKIRWAKSTIAYYRKLRETYRQLKYALSKQGDVINEQRFHTREMIAYNRTLHPLKSFFTKLVIKFSDWFSDFGQSISRPLFWLGLGHFIFFLLAIKMGAIGTLELNIFHPEISAEGTYQYLRLINPLRRPNETFNGYNIIIDILMRIWSSYMLYNIIRASRRFIK